MSQDSAAWILYRHAVHSSSVYGVCIAFIARHKNGRSSMTARGRTLGVLGVACAMRWEARLRAGERSTAHSATSGATAKSASSSRHMRWLSALSSSAAQNFFWISHVMWEER